LQCWAAQLNMDKLLETGEMSVNMYIIYYKMKELLIGNHGHNSVVGMQ